MAYDFSGTGQYINSNASFASLSCPITISIWCRPDVTATGMRMISLRRATLNSCLELGTNTSSQFFANFNYSSTNGVSAYTASSYTANTWYHVAGVFTSDTNRLVYVNGVAGDLNTDIVQTGSHTFQRPVIGCRNRTTTFDVLFNGKIQEVGVWDVALTAEEIKSLSAGFIPPKIRTSELLYYAPLVSDTNDILSRDVETVTGTPTIFTHEKRIG